jgi:hypothetical protein
MKIVPYKAEHLLAIRPQEAQQDGLPWITPEAAAGLEETEAYTALVDGKPVACAGLEWYWEGRAEAWAWISGDVTPGIFVRLNRAVQRFLAAVGPGRIEAHVDCEFGNGHRWVRALGFELEAPRKKRYFPNGRDAALYVRFN